MLVVTPEDYIGRLVILRPGYGWGWRRADNEEARIAFEPILAAGSCHVRVQRFFAWRGELRGIVAMIEQSGHLFDGLYVVCGGMCRDDYDFARNLCWRYDLEIGPVEPRDQDGWPRIVSGEPNYAGYGIVAASEAALAAFQEQEGHLHLS